MFFLFQDYSIDEDAALQAALTLSLADNWQQFPFSHQQTTEWLLPLGCSEGFTQPTDTNWSGRIHIFCHLLSMPRTARPICYVVKQKQDRGDILRVSDHKRQTLTQTIHCFGSHRSPHLDHHSMKGYLHLKRLHSVSINPPNASSMAQGCDSLCLNILNAVPHRR